MQEQPLRSLAKAASWRLLATLVTMLLVFVSTGRLLLTLSVGAFDLVGKFALYYVHERLWDRIAWGKRPPAPPRQRPLRLLGDRA